MQLIEERKRRGAAIITTIVHDRAVRDRIANAMIDMAGFAAA